MVDFLTIFTALYVLQAAGNLCIAALLFRFWRVHRKNYLRDWSCSWLALAIFHLLTPAELALPQYFASDHQLRLGASVLILTSGYWQSLWLWQGTLDLSRGQRLPPRAFRWLLAAVVLGVVLIVAGTAFLAPDHRLLWRYGLQALIAAFFLLWASWAAWRAAPTAVGSRLISLAFGLYGVTQVHYFVVSMPFAHWPAEWRLYAGFVDFFLQTGVGIGMTIWLLEDEHEKLARTSQSLVESRRFIEAITEATPHIVYVIDVHHRKTVFTNRAISQDLGFSPEEVQHMGSELLPRMLHPEDLPRYEIHLKNWRDAADHQVFELEVRVRHKQGGWRWFLTSETVFARDLQGVVTQIVGVAQDITARKEADAVLRSNEVRLRLAMEAAELGAWELDIQAGELHCSPRAQALLGLPASAAVTHDAFVERFHTADQAPVRRALIKAYNGHGPRDFELTVRVPTPTEDSRWLALQGRGFSSDQGVSSRPRVLGVVRDVTALRRAEDDRRKTETQRLHAQKLESRGVLAGGIAHDFNNLLTTMQGFAELALFDLPADAPIRDHLEHILAAARRAAELTQQMLAYAGKGRFVIQPLQLSRLVEESFELIQASISKKAEVRCTLPADLPLIQADVAQVHQIVMNLIINASDALQDHVGTITVSTGARTYTAAALAAFEFGGDCSPGTYVSFEVADTGCGMAPETLAKIFDPFFTTKFTGRGLGLAGVLGIVRSHHGAIRVTSEMGRGTTFVVLFPVAADNVVDPKKNIQRDSVDTPAQGMILVVDDEDQVREVAMRLLEAAGYSVCSAIHGEDAVRVFRESTTPIDAVLLDLTMPQMDGWETLRALRKLRPHLPILLSSGYEQDALSENRLEAGVGFVHKPYEWAELCQALQQVMNQSSF